VEIAGELTAGELSGAVPLRGPLRFGGRLEELYLSRVRALPAAAQLLLLLAAADQLGDAGKIWRAGHGLMRRWPPSPTQSLTRTGRPGTWLRPYSARMSR
jgi:hypothetical protein